jgi:hypothetical protein
MNLGCGQFVSKKAYPHPQIIPIQETTEGKKKKSLY